MGTEAQSPAASPGQGIEAVDALVLAGGTGQRLGGISKPSLPLAGRRLLDHVLSAVSGCRRTVVVAPDSVEVPYGVLRTLESPPAGGPVAGIAAGLQLLGGESRPEGDGSKTRHQVLVLACDMPGAAGAVPPLLAAAALKGVAEGVIAVDPGGTRQNLAFVADAAALRRALETGGQRDRSVRSLLGQLSLLEVPVGADALEDIDTWAQHDIWEARLRPADEEGDR